MSFCFPLFDVVSTCDQRVEMQSIVASIIVNFLTGIHDQDPQQYGGEHYSSMLHPPPYTDGYPPIHWKLQLPHEPDHTHPPWPTIY